MTVFGNVLNYTTREKLEFVNLTEIVEELVRESGIRDGMVRLSEVMELVRNVRLHTLSGGHATG